MDEEIDFLKGWLTVYPMGRARLLLFTSVQANGSETYVPVLNLRDPAEQTLQGGRFTRMVEHTFEHFVEVPIPHVHGIMDADNLDPRMDEIITWIAEETIGPWSFSFANRLFPDTHQNSPPAMRLKMRWPSPLFFFEDSRDAVKFKLTHT